MEFHPNINGTQKVDWDARVRKESEHILVNALAKAFNGLPGQRFPTAEDVLRHSVVDDDSPLDIQSMVKDIFKGISALAQNNEFDTIYIPIHCEFNIFFPNDTEKQLLITTLSKIDSSINIEINGITKKIVNIDVNELICTLKAKFPQQQRQELQQQQLQLQKQQNLFEQILELYNRSEQRSKYIQTGLTAKEARLDQLQQQLSKKDEELELALRTQEQEKREKQEKYEKLKQGQLILQKELGELDLKLECIEQMGQELEDFSSDGDWDSDISSSSDWGSNSALKRLEFMKRLELISSDSDSDHV